MKAAPLPPELRGRVFTAEQASALGISRGRLRAGDILSLGGGLFVEAAAAPDPASFVAALASKAPGIWASHQTAARIHHLGLPDALELDPVIHVGRSKRLPAVRLTGVHTHRGMILRNELQWLDGLWVSTPARTWLDLSEVLSGPDLVALGDQVLRIPRAHFEGRWEAHTTAESLEALIATHPNKQGVVAARAALGLMRVGSDSVPETKLRLALVSAGLPEPELQIALDPHDPWSPQADMGYRESRIALQYDGRPHLERQQHASDILRDAQFIRARWRYFKYAAADLRQGFSRAIEEVGEALATAA
jgi:hypothetical protein